MPDDTDRPGFQWLDTRTVRTTYDMLLYGLDDCEAEPPLSPGSRVRVGPCYFRVSHESPETATIMLVTDGLDRRRWLQYHQKRITARLFWNRPVMRVRLFFEENPLRRVCSRLGYVLLRLAGER